NSFCSISNEINIHISVRKYSREINSIFFKEWLLCRNDYKNEIEVINPSLTLSEINVLKIIRKSNIFLTHIIHQKLIQLTKSEKADDYQLTEGLRLEFSAFLSDFNNVWETCNQLLPKNEKIVVPDNVKSSLKVYNSIILSDTQFNLIMSELLKANGS